MVIIHRVHEVLRSVKIELNDISGWLNNKARARGLRRLAIAQLGSDEKFDSKLFSTKVVQLTSSKYLPQAIINYLGLSEVRSDLLFAHLRALITALQDGDIRFCKRAFMATIQESKLRSSIGKQVHDHLLYSKYVRANDAVGSMHIFAAQNDIYMKNTCGVNKASVQRTLEEYAEDLVQILVEMKVPGAKWLYLTEK